MTIDYQQLVLNNTGYYQITAGGALVYPISLDAGTWLKVSAAHTNFNRNQTWTMRFWISATPVGESISGNPYYSNRWVSPLKNAQHFAIYDITAPVAPIDPTLNWLIGLPPLATYWLNARNMENRTNGFFLKLDVAAI